LVVAHSGTAAEGNHSSLDVDTTQWINHQIAQGHNRIELDEQVSSDGHGFAFHDRTLNKETKKGKGVVHTKTIKYLNGLKSNHGGSFANSDDLIRILKQNPKVDFQHEFKDYDNQWTPQFLAAWYAQFSAAGVMNQIHVSSSSARVLSWFHTNHPEVHDLQLIGFGNYLPNLDTAVKAGATQVNAGTSALNKYKGHPSYLSAARARGLNTSIRSKPNGNGDNGKTWLKAVKFGVDQIVTQGPTKAEVCNAVRNAAR
jgi:glycerophosphoryl diester phosphodiesterase